MAAGAGSWISNGVLTLRAGSPGGWGRGEAKTSCLSPTYLTSMEARSPLVC